MCGLGLVIRLLCYRVMLGTRAGLKLGLLEVGVKEGAGGAGSCVGKLRSKRLCWRENNVPEYIAEFICYDDDLVILDEAQSGSFFWDFSVV
jgi:hypothetical protein